MENEMRLYPVGVVQSELKKPINPVHGEDLGVAERITNARALHQKLKTLVAELVIDPDFEGILEGIEDFSHILVLYWPHLLPARSRGLRQVHPMGRKDLPRVGIFATCSPARPNPVLVSAAELLERDGNVLRVKGLDALDGSLIIDIKPYEPGYYGVKNPTLPAWLNQVHAEIENDPGNDRRGEPVPPDPPTVSAEKVLESAEFKKCADFHGHICPGLSIGFRAAKEAMARLAEQRSEDEEIVAIVETDACSADAVQVLTGCTFGKGNFIYKDYGKMVLTLLSRHTGKGVRVAMAADVTGPSEEHLRLMKRVRSGEADDAQRERFRRLHRQRSCDILEMPVAALFTVTPVEMALPSPAAMAPSEPCQRCGEPTMGTKLELVGNQKICRDCVES